MQSYLGPDTSNTWTLQGAPDTRLLNVGIGSLIHASMRGRLELAMEDLQQANLRAVLEISFFFFFLFFFLFYYYYYYC